MKLYKARKDFAMREMDSETVLIPTGEQVFRNNSIVILNETAKIMWNALEKEMNVAEIIKVLVDEFDVFAYEVLDDVDRFIRTLLNVDALEVREVEMDGCSCPTVA